MMWKIISILKVGKKYFNMTQLQAANLQKTGSEGLLYYLFRTKKEDISEVH